MISKCLIELKLNEEQGKITQTVTGATNAQMKPTAYDEYVNASKGKGQKGKGKGAEGKGNKQACSDYWRPDGCSLGHHCPNYHPRRQPGICAVGGSTKHYNLTMSAPGQAQAKNAEYEEHSTWNAEAEWEEQQQRRMRQRKVKRVKERDPSLKGNLKGGAHRDHPQTLSNPEFPFRPTSTQAQA